MKKAQDLYVSVIIPTYESAETLQRCLQSLQEQSHPINEIIVVDAFSRDNTQETAYRFGAKVILIRGTQAFARNIGVKKSMGDYLLFVDSDQILGKETIQECVETCLSRGVHAVKIPEVFFGSNFWSECSAFWRNHVNLVVGEEGGIPRFYHRKCLMEAGLFNEKLRLWEDYDLYQRVKASGAEIVWCKSCIYHQERPSLGRMLSKGFRYGKSVLTFLERSTEKSCISIHRITLLTLSNVLKDIKKSPLLAIGCLLLSVLKGCAMLLGITHELFRRILKK